MRAPTVRQATIDDLQTVLAMRMALLREHRDNLIYGRLRRDARDRAVPLYTAQLQSPHEAIFLAECEGDAVGMMRCVHSAGSPLLEPSHYGYVSSVYVRPDARRSQVATRLLEAVEEWCRERGLPEIRLHNAADNETANAVWDALGFEVVEHVRIRPLRST